MTTAVVSLDVIRQEGQGLLAEIEAIAICDAESFAVADDYLTAVKTYRKRVAEITGPTIKAAQASLAAARAQHAALDEAAEAAEKALKKKLTDYDAEQRRLAAEAARAAQVERERLEREQRAAERAAALAATPTAGVAVVVPPAPAAVFVPPAPVEVPRASGLSFRDNWSAEVVDLMALARAVVEGTVPIDAIAPGMTWLNASARTLKSTLAIPGVRAVNTPVASKRV